MNPDSTLAVTNTCPKDGVHLCPGRPRSCGRGSRSHRSSRLAGPGHRVGATGRWSVAVGSRPRSGARPHCARSTAVGTRWARGPATRRTTASTRPRRSIATCARRADRDRRPNRNSARPARARRPARRARRRTRIRRPPSVISLAVDPPRTARREGSRDHLAPHKAVRSCSISACNACSPTWMHNSKNPSRTAFRQLSKGKGSWRSTWG